MTDSDDGDQMLSPAEAAIQLGVTPRFLAGHRTKGTGPRFIRLSHSVIRYRRSELNTWLESRTAPSQA